MVGNVRMSPTRFWIREMFKQKFNALIKLQKSKSPGLLGYIEEPHGIPTDKGTQRKRTHNFKYFLTKPGCM